MKVILLPFGSYLVGESRDQDFVAFHFDQTLVELLDDSRIQRDAYVQGLGFFNTKSEIAQAAEALQLANFSDALAFLTGQNAPGWNEPDPIYKMIGVLTYQSKHGCILSVPGMGKRDAGRMYLTPIESRDGRVCVFWEEIYTYKSSSGVIEIEKETWSMLLSIDLKEVQ